MKKNKPDWLFFFHSRFRLDFSLAHLDQVFIAPQSVDGIMGKLEKHQAHAIHASGIGRHIMPVISGRMWLNNKTHATPKVEKKK